MSTPKWALPAMAAIAVLLMVFLVTHKPATNAAHGGKKNHGARKLGSTRLGDDGHIDPKYEHRGFDPEAAAHEPGHEEDDEWSSYHDHHHHEGDYHSGDGDYGDWEDNFNITERLQELFPLIDSDGDGKVTVVEMQVWHHHNGLNVSRERAGSEHESSDTDQDGLVSLKEYLAEDEFSEEGQEGESDVEGEGEDDYNSDWVRSTKISFGLADVNKDGHLNVEEYFIFLHPEESDNKELHAHLRNEDIHDRDDDKDGKLNFEEFESGLWYALSSSDGGYGEEEEGEGGEDSGESWEEKDKREAKAMFEKLDADKDGHIVADELIPVMDELHPTEETYSKQQAAHMMEQADEDKDNHLTLGEMTENPYVFYSAAFGEDHHDYSYHDEFR